MASTQKPKGIGYILIRHTIGNKIKETLKQPMTCNLSKLTSTKCKYITKNHIARHRIRKVLVGKTKLTWRAKSIDASTWKVNSLSLPQILLIEV